MFLLLKILTCNDKELAVHYFQRLIRIKSQHMLEGFAVSCSQIAIRMLSFTEVQEMQPMF